MFVSLEPQHNASNFTIGTAYEPPGMNLRVAPRLPIVGHGKLVPVMPTEPPPRRMRALNGSPFVNTFLPGRLHLARL